MYEVVFWAINEGVINDVFLSFFDQINFLYFCLTKGGFRILVLELIKIDRFSDLDSDLTVF